MQGLFSHKANPLQLAISARNVNYTRIQFLENVEVEEEMW